jgi:uncharacterized protein YjiS (DUF1127 family)
MTTTTDYNDAPASPVPAGLGLGRLFRSWLASARRRRQARLTLFELSRLDAHLLRDMGINPADVRDALAGRWSSVWLDPMRRFDQE